jgi:hypothetical protein
MAKTTLTETKPLGQLVVALRTPLLGVAGEMESALPLEHTAVTAQVTGLLVSVAVTQRFGNPLSKPTGLDYLFPLPHEAAITDFELRIGQRNVRAEIKELEQARATYEEAQKAGQRAGLLEQRRPNLFAVRLANVLPGETVLATVRYQQRLKLDSGWFEFVYPMGLTPKYGSPTHPDESIGVQAPIAKPGEVIGAIELSLSVDAGVPVGEPTSPSHPIEINRIDEHRFQVSTSPTMILSCVMPRSVTRCRSQPGSAPTKAVIPSWRPCCLQQWKRRHSPARASLSSCWTVQDR